MRELVNTKVVFNPATGQLTVNGMDLGLLVDEVDVRLAGHSGATEVTLRLPLCDVEWEKSAAAEISRETDAQRMRSLARLREYELKTALAQAHELREDRDVLVGAARELDLEHDPGLTGLRLAVERVESGRTEAS